MGVRQRAVSQRKLAAQTRSVEDGEWRMIQPEAAPCMIICSSCSDF